MGLNKESKELSILAVSYAFPPLAFPRSIQVARLLSGLDADIVVVCAENPKDGHDPTIAPDIEKKIKYILRVPFKRNTFFRFMDAIAYKIQIPWANLPDKYCAWVKTAMKYYKRWQKKNGFKPELLITFAQPMSDHLFGLAFKKATGTPWIAHFSDPWTDNPYRTDNFFTSFINRILEKKVITMADAVVFTSQETMDLVLKKYSGSFRKKAFSIPHCYDPGVYDSSLTPPANKYVIRYLGEFYGNRTPHIFIDALETVYKNVPELLENVICEFVGSSSKRGGLLEKHPLLKEVVNFREKVTYLESIKLMQTAHCLLVIDAVADFSVFFPSKIADYVGAGRFIFAITPRGASSRIIKIVGGIAASPQEPESVSALLRKILAERPSCLNSSIEICNYYSKDNAVRMAQEIISNVVEFRKHGEKI